MLRLLATLCLALAVVAQRPADRAAALHRSLLIVDTHNDVTSRTVEGFDLGRPDGRGHTDLPRLRAGNVGAVFFAAYVAAGYAAQGRAAHRALEMIDTIRHDIVDRHPTDFVLALTAADVERAHREGKIAALIGIEGGHAIEDSLRLLRSFYRLGVRYMTLTHSNTNNWADSSGDEDDPRVKRHNGLTAFGRDVVREMNRLGMIVDISHVSDKTFWDVLETSRAPVMASHSSCRSLANIARNMSDEMIVALAKKGGVIHINFGCEFVSQASASASPWANRDLARKLREIPDAAARAAAIRKAAAEMPRATMADVVAHIDHVVKLAGVDAVGIGSDFDGVGCTPEGLEDVSKFPNLTRALLERGYSESDIRKIYGGNTLRLMREVERVAEVH
ncbi:MAG: dipeptidase [Bryobacterales bacterium]|nr:dipeptidase [Bryobacteraceae bacterium]MDW8354381.1 dipeptidase [Bryobacterales bacterium]